MLACEGCHDLKVVPYLCRDVFCTTYSCGEAEEWSRGLSEDVCQVNHRQGILTNDEGLRDMSMIGVGEACPEFQCWRLTPVARIGL
uniref:transposase zinc-binding domain-containing protein n=1 Tax=Paenibacillus marchantiophytorum TaxID=1619310 RepID=UPI003570FCED